MKFAPSEEIWPVVSAVISAFENADHASGFRLLSCVAVKYPRCAEVNPARFELERLAIKAGVNFCKKALVALELIRARPSPLALLIAGAKLVWTPGDTLIVILIPLN